ncbi:MAG: LytR C-terminal domain-containing protein [Kineosporiaceae bacterium]|nr:LytR C-terminal domain-containing protein [Aeromicrobium sp.]
MNRPTAQLTLAAVVVVFLASTAYGVKLVTAPVATTAAGPTCEARTVKAGENVTPNLVKVNVFNASQRSGLANRVNINLQRRGFLGGKIGNDTGGIATKTVTIITSDRADPQVKLLAAQFKDKARYAAPKDTLGSGVTIIVGDGYSGLASKASRSVKSDRTLQFCLPIVPVG